MQKSDGSGKKGISQEQLDAISAQISELAEQRFVNLNLSADLVEAVQMQLLGKSVPQDPTELTEEFIETTLFPRAVESVFENYRKNCYRICLSKTKDHHISEDIAQEAISLLLSSKNRVENASAWLAKVTYNLFHVHYKNTKKEAQLYERLSQEATSFEKWLESGDLLELKELDAALADQLLQSDEYEQYREIASYKSIKKYAAAHGIGEKAAQKKKNMARRNLKAKALRGMGWRSSPEILDYHQYDAIHRFILEVQRMCSGDESIKWMESLSPENAEAVKRVKVILDWGVLATGEHSYVLNLFTIFEDLQPFMFTFNIVLSQRNSISIQDVTVNKLADTHMVPDKVRICTDKGRVMLTYEQIISLLKRD